MERDDAAASSRGGRCGKLHKLMRARGRTITARNEIALGV